MGNGHWTKRPRGLGIINTRIMNDCLLVKWIWKMFQEPDELWFKLVKAKYMSEGSFFDSNIKGSSQFWQGLHKIKHLFKWGRFLELKMGITASSRLIVGYMMFLSGSCMKICLKWLENLTSQLQIALMRING